MTEQSTLKQTLARLGIRPSRRLGQNFLTDPNMLSALVRDAAPTAGDRILEIGPGTGLLTERLLEAGATVTAVEIDYRLAAHLRSTLGTHKRLRIIEADACRIDPAECMPEDPYRCIANLPYSVSSVVLARFADTRRPPVDVHVLLQREIADRILAEPGTKDYSALSVKVQLLFEGTVLRTLPPQVFYPPPDVDSAFIRLVRTPGAVRPGVRRLAVELAQTAFAQRRKKALKLLGRRWDRDRLQAHFRALGIDDNARAEAIAVCQYAALASRLAAAGPTGEAPE